MSEIEPPEGGYKHLDKEQLQRDGSISQRIEAFTVARIVGWIKRGYCPHCVLTHALIGAADAAILAGWELKDVHKCIDAVYEMKKQSFKQ